MTGCLSQRYLEALFQEILKADGFGVAITTGSRRCLKGCAKRAPCDDRGRRTLPAPWVLTTPPYSAYVKISDGCDNRCTTAPFPDPGRLPPRTTGTSCRSAGNWSGRGQRDHPDRPGHLPLRQRAAWGKLLLPDLLRDVSNLEGCTAAGAVRYPDTVDERLLTPCLLPGPPPDLPLQHINGTLLKV